MMTWAIEMIGRSSYFLTLHKSKNTIEIWKCENLENIYDSPLKKLKCDPCQKSSEMWPFIIDEIS